MRLTTIVSSLMGLVFLFGVVAWNGLHKTRLLGALDGAENEADNFQRDLKKVEEYQGDELDERVLLRSRSEEGQEGPNEDGEMSQGERDLKIFKKIFKPPTDPPTTAEPSMSMAPTEEPKTIFLPFA